MIRKAVGKNVDSWCTKCKLVLAHTIEAYVDGKISRVHCNTCGAQHAYRPRPPGEKSPQRKSASASARAKPSRGNIDPAANYRSLLQGRNPSSARPYSPRESFRESELIMHSAFGLGIVVAKREGNKIEVAFADRPRTMIHTGN
jgi:hypothetical protein